MTKSRSEKKMYNRAEFLDQCRSAILDLCGDLVEEGATVNELMNILMAVCDILQKAEDRKRRAQKMVQ